MFQAYLTDYPQLRGAVIHHDRGSQYTNELYWKVNKKYAIKWSMNKVRGRYHDNARCESMWGRLKEELFYGRYEILTK